MMCIYNMEDEAIERAEEGLSLLNGLIHEIATGGPYTQETTLNLLGQIRACFVGECSLFDYAYDVGIIAPTEEQKEYSRLNKLAAKSLAEMELRR